MGGHSSKALTVPGSQHSSTSPRDGSRCSSSQPEGVSAAAHSRLHEGPILSLCAVRHDHLLSGGKDKVHGAR